MFYWLSSCVDFNFNSAVLHLYFSFSLLSVDMVFNSRFKMDVDSLMTWIHLVLTGFWLRKITWSLLNTD